MTVDWSEFEVVDTPKVDWGSFTPITPEPIAPKFDAASAQQPVATTQDISEASKPWYEPPPEWSEPLGGRTEVPSGVGTSIPAITIPASAIGKTVGGVADWATSPKGMTEIGASMTPAAPLVMIKWAKDMIESGKASLENIGETLKTMMRDGINRGMIDQNQLGVPPEATDKQMQEHLQDLADNTVGLLGAGLGVAGIGHGLISKAKAVLPKAADEARISLDSDTAKIQAGADPEAIESMERPYEVQRALAGGSPFMRATVPPGIVTMGPEQGGIPALGTGPTFDPSGIRMAPEPSQPAGVRGEIPMGPQLEQMQPGPTALREMQFEFQRRAALKRAEGSPFMADAPTGPITMGPESRKIPFLGTKPTFPPTGIELSEAPVEDPIVSQFSEAFGRPPTPEETQQVLSGQIEIPERQDRTVTRANAVREQAAQRARTLDFSKAVSERISQEQEPPIHPDKSLTANQLKIIHDSLVDAVGKNQIPGPNKGLIVGSALEKWADDVLRGGGTHGGADVFAAYLVRGAAFIEKGITEFGKWSAAMVKEFGPKIEQHLKQIYKQAVEMRAKDFLTKTKGESNATRIRSDEGQVQTGRTERQGGEVQGGENLEQPASGKPGDEQTSPPTAPKEGQPGVLLNKPLTPAGKSYGVLTSIRNRLINSWNTRGNKSDIARSKDAADSQSKIFANQQGKSVALDAKRLFPNNSAAALKAVIPVIESGGDKSKLDKFIAQSEGKHAEAQQAAQFAKDNWDRLQPLAAKVKQIHDTQIREENFNGIDTEYRENYIQHAFDVNKLPNRGEEFFSAGGGTGKRSGFKAARKFETIYDAIEAGYGKALKSIDASKLTENRLRSGQQLINDRLWIKSFRDVTDPTTNKPIITDTTQDRNGVHIAPPGYDAISVMPGQFLAVHNGYRGIFDAVTGASKLAEAEVGGLPIGKAILNTASGIKHGLLLFDTFHASRVMQKQFFLTGRVGYSKGLSLLEYTDSDLSEAVKQGEITPAMEKYARENRPTAELLVKEGLNVGRIQESLRSELIKNLPVIGTFNKWVFDKVTRGAMMQSALIEFDRISKSNPDMSPKEVAARVAKQTNITFGNIGRQGLFKSRTFQDISRLILLAPQWVESMARSEIGGFGQLAKVPVDLAMGKGLQVGTLGKAMAGGLMAYFVGTQLLNLATRKQFTWQNKEEGHKLDAWIPDFTGKTKGFFLNPLSVVAELTHDAYRYAFKKDNALDIAKQVAENKASPLMRAASVLWSGKNFMGEKIDGTWKRIAESGAALIPAPIPVQAAASTRPGQLQRQITGSLGIKTEPAPTALQEVRSKASVFMKSQGKGKRVDITYHESDPESLLRKAIENGDDKQGIKAIEELRKGQSDSSILRGQLESSRRAFTSRRLESKFLSTLTPEEKALYQQAKQERVKAYQKFLELWRQRQVNK